jgi:hypothetical protein
MGMGGQRHAPVALPQQRDPVHIVQEAGWDPRPVSTGAGNFGTIGILTAERPARNKSLYVTTLTRRMMVNIRDI